MKNTSRNLGTTLLIGSLVAAAQATPSTQEAVRIAPPPQTGPAVESGQDELQPEPVPGEILAAEHIEEGWIETMAEVMEREAARTEPYPENPKGRNGAQGTWEVPTIRRSTFAHSGKHYAAAKWGDTSMGIAFNGEVDLQGVWVAGHMDIRAWTPAVRALGYRDGDLVAQTEWFEDVDDSSDWFPIAFDDVDRVVFEAKAVFEGAGFYGIDDLTFVRDGDTVVVDFEDLTYRTKLTGTGYAGLTWETGTGDFSQQGILEMPAPQTQEGAMAPATPPDPDDSLVGPGGAQASSQLVATLPTFVRRFAGPKQTDPGGGWTPPDTVGAIGTTQFVASVNQHLSVYDRVTQQRLTSVSLQSFFNTSGSAGDPRVAFDHHHNRWIVLVTDFSSRLRFAYSLTEDATGAWYKTNITVSTGQNAGNWPDYQTLGVDANGIYTAAYMVGSVGGMSIFAIDKAPLLTATPAVGTVSAWRQLPWEGAIQPCVTYGNPGSQYLISRRTGSSQRIRRIDGPMTSPNLVEVGFTSTKNGNSPPSAPALGSSFNLDTLDGRPMNAVYRNGAIWMTHCVNKSGRAAINWYKIQASNAALLDEGTVKDDVMSFFMPAISVNQNDDVLIGFTASSPNMYASCWYTGRLGTDPASEMAVPAEYKPGNGAYNQSGGGTNRWGDYSLTSVDPLDDTTMWTIQEFSNQNGDWATNIAEFSFASTACGVATSYCTAGVSASGCQATMSTLGTPSATQPTGFSLVASGVEGAKDGLFFYGTNGPQANPWGNGSSFQCVTPPVFRAGLLNGTGSTGACNGAFSQDMHALWSSNPAKNPGPGATVQAQAWYRDPMNTSNQTTSLSDAVEFTVCP